MSPGMIMARVVVSITIIADGMAPPIRMASDPDMETIQADRVAKQPDITRPQIIILVADETNVFITIPYVIIRYHHRLRCRRDNYRRRSCNDDRGKSHPSIRGNNTAGSEHQSSGHN
jgi:hypothetical protein